MKPKITTISYCLPLTEDQWDRLDSIDCLKYEQFEKEMRFVGATDPEWSGHFGRNLFFAIEADDNGEVQGLDKVLDYLKSVLGGNMTHYFIFYERIHHPGSGFKFKCNADGEIDEDHMTLQQRTNLRNCRENKWQEYMSPRKVTESDGH